MRRRPLVERHHGRAGDDPGYGYAIGVAPDRKNSINIVFAQTLATIPIDLAYCPGCREYPPSPKFPGEQDIEPLPVVTIDPVTLGSAYWLSGRARFSADDLLPLQTRADLVDPSVVWLAPSEPITMVLISTIPRAVSLSADGTTIVDTLIETATSYVTRRAQRDVSLLALAGPPPRSGFGAAYSRHAAAVFVAGGRLPDGTAAADVWTFRNGNWTGLPLLAARQPLRIEAATFAWDDARLWLVDRDSSAGKPRWFLYRVSPATGVAETLRELKFLAGYSRVWLRTIDDGRVLLAASDDNNHFISVLGSDIGTRFAPDPQIRLSGFAFGPGRLLKAPELRYGSITRAVTRKVGNAFEVIVEHAGTVDGLGNAAGGLSADL